MCFMSSQLWADTERDSVSARLTQLFMLPAKVYEIPVGEGQVIRVKLRLMNDQESFEVADIVDRYGLLGQAVMERRHILARSILWLEDQPLEMPVGVKQEFRDRSDRPPTEIEEKLWVLELCQSVVLDAIFAQYSELAREQKVLVSALKKNYEQSLTGTSPEMKSPQ